MGPLYYGLTETTYASVVPLQNPTEETVRFDLGAGQRFGHPLRKHATRRGLRSFRRFILGGCPGGGAIPPRLVVETDQTLRLLPGKGCPHQECHKANDDRHDDTRALPCHQRPPDDWLRVPDSGCQQRL